MAYIGKAPNTAIVNQTTSQSFNGTGSATAFTLNRSVNVGEDLEVFVNNVQQEPGSGKSYTASGTTLTFDEAPPSGTGNIYVIYRGEATINPRLEHDANAALAATTGTFSGDLTVDTNTLFVDSTNNKVSIGKTGPSYKTEISDGTVTFGVNPLSAYSTAYVGTTTNHAMNLITNGNSRLNIDSSGNVGIGTSSPTLDGSLAGLSVNGSGTVLHVNDGDGATLKLSDPATSANRGLGITLQGTSAAISNCESGELRFGTGNTERMRITSGGNIGINETNPTLMLSLQTGVSMGLGDLSDYSTKGILGNIHPSISSQSLGSTSVDDVRQLGFGSTYVPSAGGTKPTSYGTIRCFEHYNGNLNKGARYLSQLAVGHANNPAWYIRNSNTTDGTSFGTWYQIDVTSTSDERSKENVEDAPDQLAVVKQFQVKEFDYIDNADEPRQLGMMAQHVDTFAPEYVTKDDEDPDIMWRIKYNKMVPMLVKALQEATTKIETLETEMTALKARVTALEGN